MVISTRQPTITQLRAFLAVAELLHFRDAAAALGMSQPALSNAIASLEENLGAQLVERTTRRVLLTPAGERIAHHARRVLDALDDLVEAAHAARRPLTGPLNLGIIPTVAPYLLPALLRPLAKEFPDLAPQVFEEQTARLLDGLLNGRLDVVILALPTELPGVTEIPLYDEDFVLVVQRGHKYDGAAGLPRRVLRDLDVLLLDEGHCLRDQTLDVCREAGLRRHSATRAASLSTLVQLVTSGLGVTLLPETAVPVETQRGAGLGVARFADPAPFRRIGLVYRSSSARGHEFAALADCVRRVVQARLLPARLAA
ncbi:DNA-binding transcriptional regulator OxyR [Carbonactinospora thermoautotrophica]|uniref:LysR substrate-binding domain-containing protein n=1 Tax=Carbonactinospora thermoautotrophica TaxID=1469144 RepID=UPI00226F4FE6|nr:LysR substrate-binding domain-containing protein [Carbonactinospora thermoautotrophica]MCX9191569.1 DNA-binding transcriptional regulator OxyR [Carbonactinospora thermoautotrophica]